MISSRSSFKTYLFLQNYHEQFKYQKACQHELDQQFKSSAMKHNQVWVSFLREHHNRSSHSWAFRSTFSFHSSFRSHSVDHSTSVSWWTRTSDGKVFGGKKYWKCEKWLLAESPKKLYQSGGWTKLCFQNHHFRITYIKLSEVKPCAIHQNSLSSFAFVKRETRNSNETEMLKLSPERSFEILCCLAHCDDH